MNQTLYIKNMVCPRCIMAVETVLDELEIPYKSVQLGQVDLSQAMPKGKMESLDKKLKGLGFELLESGKSTIISQIKTLIIDQIHHKNEALRVNFSTLLSDQLHHDYTYLSRLFSSVEGITIEKFITKQRIEKVKEMLFYDELTLAEIAFKLDYSSTAYLSTQFKKETGMTPTQFKKMHSPGHRHLDSL
ncbi:helix-turn-helix domain-containing protein [Arthrospiribacter ruber]|uniref:AraC family transcriptional regulator n=1 Tax=Arthrospiribacter ruber TaxID=2487934 RepID=A0A951MD95_9BACT|nr:AraC family transcriptional regulator [Arthrospiribacter ruber]MBW3467076.1 AraC family transcriptional regulator [Arthrospiribacter ruber]